MERHQHAVVKNCPIWGRFGYKLLTTRASHNKRDGFGTERATFGDEAMSVASYCFQKNFQCEHRTTGVLCYVLEFFGVRLDFFIH